MSPAPHEPQHEPSVGPDGRTEPHTQKSPAGPGGESSSMGSRGLHGVAGPSPGVCGARNRQGNPCQKPVVPGRTRCRLHGGASPCGVAASNFKTGRHSKYLKDLPAAWRKGYQSALSDPELTSLKEELAVLTAAIGERLARLKGGGEPPWEEAAKALDAFQAAITSKDAERFRITLAVLEGVVRGGAASRTCRQAARREVRELIQERTKVAEAEARRLAVLRCMVTVEEAFQLWQALLAAAKEVITDKAMLRRLQDRVLQLLPSDN